MPTVIQRDIVARELIRKYPALKINIGEGHEGWSVKIFDKIKNDLKKKKQFQHKRKLCDSSKNLLEYPAKNIKHLPVTDISDEKRKLIENEKETMFQEMSKPPSNRYSAIIEQALKKTFNDRRRLIESNIPLGELKKEYPALFTVTGMYYDFKVAYNIDLQKTFLNNLASCSPGIIKYAHKKKINDLLTTEEDDNNINYRIIQVALILPLIFEEKPDYIYKKYPVEATLDNLQDVPVTPHLSIIGDPFTSSEVYVVAENITLIDCSNFIEGISILLGLYFVANIAYPKEAIFTYKFLEYYILKFPCKKIPRKLLTLSKFLS